MVYTKLIMVWNKLLITFSLSILAASQSEEIQSRRITHFGVKGCGKQAIEDYATYARNINNEQTINETGRVIGGQVTKYGAHPWQIQISSTQPQKYQCGGAIISEYFALTAAHCLHGCNVKNLRIKVGDYNKNIVDSYEDDFEIDKVALHENFQRGNVYANDIALVKIKSKRGSGFNFLNSYVYPVCLPTRNTPAYPKNKCLVSGWGQIDASNEDSLSVILHHAEVPILSHSDCKSLYRNYASINDGMLCAGYLMGGVDACKGDSGGPLVCQIMGKFVLYGLVSWGNGCAQNQQPGVYTRIHHYISWIQEKIRSLSPRRNQNPNIFQGTFNG